MASFVIRLFLQPMAAILSLWAAGIWSFVARLPNHSALPSNIEQQQQQVSSRHPPSNQCKPRTQALPSPPTRSGGHEPSTIDNQPLHPASIFPVEYIPVPGEWQRAENPNLPDSAFQVPEAEHPGQVYYIQKGFFICNGAGSRVELLPAGGRIVKTPLENPLNPLAERLHRICMEREVTVYRLLGNVPFIPRFLDWGSVSHTLTLEHLESGSLDVYLPKHNIETSAATRTRWVVQAAQALAGLHAKRIIHADVASRNFLLTETLDIRVCDFAGSSFPGNSISPSAPGSRYQARPWASDYVPVAADDVS